MPRSTLNNHKPKKKNMACFAKKFKQLNKEWKDSKISMIKKPQEIFSC